MGTGIGLFLPWKNEIYVTGTGIWSLGLGFGHWECEKNVKNGNGK